jgi:hypothetical protein
VATTYFAKANENITWTANSRVRMRDPNGEDRTVSMKS